MVAERGREALWTLEELAARVALALSVDYDGQPSGRVRDVPDGRIVRYYTTLGLVDRPARYAGRVALYARRHLEQIVAIKRLQQRGRSLSEIQQAFATLDERALARLAALPEASLDLLATKQEPKQERQKEREAAEPAKPEPPRRFWNAAPAPAVTQAAVTAGRSSSTSSRSRGDDERGTVPAAAMTGVAISPEVVLLAAFARGLDEADVEAIRAAAAPLLKVLEKRGLLGK